MGKNKHTELKKRVGRVVLRLRKEAELGQEKFAVKAGIHRTQLSLLERGKTIPSLVMLQSLATGFGISASALVAEIEKEPVLPDDSSTPPKGRPRKTQKPQAVPKAKGK